MPILALILVTAVWGVTFVQVEDALKHGGTRGSPVGPLLHTSRVRTEQGSLRAEPGSAADTVRDRNAENP